MQTARVLGHAISTVKHPSMEGWKLSVIQPTDAVGAADGFPALAVDPLGAGLGQTVIISSDGKFTRELLQVENSPVRWSIMGIADE
jgi:microcompartment protein CcmK/EutM